MKSAGSGRRGPRVRKRPTRESGRTSALDRLRARLGLSSVAMTVLATDVRARRAAGAALGKAPSTLTLEQALGRLQTLPVQVSPEVTSLIEGLEAFESRRAPGVFGLSFPADRAWEVEGGARELEVEQGKARRGKVTVGMPPGSALYSNGRRPGLLVAATASGLEFRTLGSRGLGPPPAALADEILIEFGAPAWLAREARMFTSAEGPLAPVVGLGILARLWAGGVPESGRKRMLARIRKGDSPSRRLERWWEMERSRRWADVEAAALELVSELTRGLGTLASSRRRATRGSPPAALDWLRRRDDLSAVEYVAPVESRRRLAPAIRELDRLASRNGAVFKKVDVTQDDRLLAVSWMEPDAWWPGDLA